MSVFGGAASLKDLGGGYGTVVFTLMVLKVSFAMTRRDALNVSGASLNTPSEGEGKLHALW